MILRSAWYLALVLARQYGTTSGMRRSQLRGVNAMLAHAVRSVPYYRRHKGYHRAPLPSLAHLRELPLLTKQQVRELTAADLVADDVDRRDCVEVVTSGTTGQRLAILHDRRHEDRQNAAAARRWLATGRYLPVHRMSALRATPVDSYGVQRLGLFRRQVVLTSVPAEQWPELLLRFRPHVLVAYPVHMRELRRVLTGDQLARLRTTLRAVLTDSEMLTGEQRAAITEEFGVPVFDEYSSFETLQIYYECARGGRHIAEDLVHVEVVDEHGEPVPDGTEGRIVCTAFRERAMPLIRYVLGDVGVIDQRPCRCGRRFRTMRLTRGRLNDSIVLPDGRRLFADRFIAMVVGHPGVAGLFARQDATGAVRVHVAPDGTVPLPRLLSTVRETLVAQAGQEFPLEVQPVDRVPLTPGGKARVVESDYRS